MLVVLPGIAMTRASLGEATEELLGGVFKDFGRFRRAWSSMDDKTFAMGQIPIAKGLFPATHR